MRQLGMRGLILGSLGAAFLMAPTLQALPLTVGEPSPAHLAGSTFSADDWAARVWRAAAEGVYRWSHRPRA